MLMDERLVALNTVLGHCRELAELYGGDRMAVDAQSKALFEDCARAHDRFADELATEIRRQGDLPAEEDPERLGVERLVADVKSFFSPRREASLAETFAEIESRLDQALGAARAQVDAPMDQLLAQHQAAVRRHLDALKQIGDEQGAND